MNEITRKEYKHGFISYHWNPEKYEVVVVNNFAPLNSEDGLDSIIVGSLTRVSELTESLK